MSTVSDHFKPSTAKALALCRPGLRWGCCSWMLPSITEIVPLRQVDALECGTVYDYGAFTVKPERVPHNVPNCGYHIQIGNERCFYATDLSSIEHVQAKGYDLLAIEGNHHRDEIEERIRAKRAAGEYAYEIEAMRNHLSIEQAMDWISTMSDSHTKYVLLHGHVDR